MTQPEQAEVDRLAARIEQGQSSQSRADRLARARQVVLDAPLTTTPRHRATVLPPVSRSDDAGPEVSRLLALADKISRPSSP